MKRQLDLAWQKSFEGFTYWPFTMNGLRVVMIKEGKIMKRASNYFNTFEIARLLFYGTCFCTGRCRFENQSQCALFFILTESP